MADPELVPLRRTSPARISAHASRRPSIELDRVVTVVIGAGIDHAEEPTGSRVEGFMEDATHPRVS
jgi:hypothetical protein